jgi:hypothetical protein
VFTCTRTRCSILLVRFLQQQKNGEKLAALYSNLVGTKFDRNSMYVRSTDVSRTFASIESLLLAFFPTVCSRKKFCHSICLFIYLFI